MPMTMGRGAEKCRAERLLVESRMRSVFGLDCWSRLELVSVVKDDLFSEAVLISLCLGFIAGGWLDWCCNCWSGHSSGSGSEVYFACQATSPDI